MDQEQSPQAVVEKSDAAKPSNSAAPRQAVTGVMPPQLGEAIIREAWTNVTGISPMVSGLAKRLTHTVILAPVAWLLLGGLLLIKFAPFIAKRYTLTNRRLMIRRGLKPQPSHEVSLADIDEVRIDPKSVDDFYRAGTLEIVSKGQVVLTLPGVPEPEGFRHVVIDSCKAWVPGKATGPFQPASAVK
jgi:uncharacterized membrane protein YdbT with pleckstrin-like domain